MGDELSSRWSGLDVASFRAELDRISPELHRDFVLTRAVDQRIASALSEFDAILREEISRVVRPMNAALVDDVTQSVRERLLTPDASGQVRILDYRGEGSLRAWLRAIGVRTALNAQRALGSPAPEADELPLAENDPELELFRARYRESFRGAFATAVAQLSPRDRSILKLHTLDGVSLSRIGAIYRKDTSTVSRWMEAIRKTLREATLKELSSRLSLSPLELESVQRAAGFEVSVSLGRLLQE